MIESSPRFWEIFFEVFEALPRQGPGGRASTRRALGMCPLPPRPAVVDLGCGTGGQTLDLAELTPGTIVALDNHAPFIERLRAAVAERGLEGRVRAVVGDMANPGLPDGSFNLVWSEGALYSIGLENALRVCYGLLRPGGCLAFTNAVWLKADPPPEVKAAFDFDYPAIGRVADDLAAIAGRGFSLVGHFRLPDQDWWDDFYTPMEKRIAELRLKYAAAADAEALGVLDQVAREPEMHREYSDYYAYEFYVVRR